MRGAITGKDVVLHSLTIVRLWGVAAYLGCLWATIARRRSTFLGVLYPASVAPSRSGPIHPMRGGPPCAGPRRPTR